MLADGDGVRARYFESHSKTIGVSFSGLCGTGFGAWTLVANGGPANSGFFRASSNFNGSNGAPGIDAGGFSWGTYANSGFST